MKAECKEIANSLLAVDNTLAFALCSWQHHDVQAVGRGLDVTIDHLKELLERGKASPEELEPFKAKRQEILELIAGRDPPRPELLSEEFNAWAEQRDQKVIERLQSLHELSEQLLLEKVIACECGKGG